MVGLLSFLKLDILILDVVELGGDMRTKTQMRHDE
jgi:hypothetical protein